MSAINVKPLPPKDGMGIGFWVDLKAQLATAVSILEENSLSDDSHDSSSDSLETTDIFDPTVNTVSELQTAVDVIIAAKSDVL
jgi:hypothetical protein